ncbi:hypothetical protein CEXT_501411 [Caerostris extrusa]|uniref:Uncharacterized protein n=1 Tax=Caerostris extrusa TaxID=172846 RepID=A0AAV4SAD8_CAEEX|nr:hypothetical protein CEXT_501411 [Caerostris extrusa]
MQFGPGPLMICHPQLRGILQMQLHASEGFSNCCKTSECYYRGDADKTIVYPRIDKSIYSQFILSFESFILFSIVNRHLTCREQRNMC